MSSSGQSPVLSYERISSRNAQQFQAAQNTRPHNDVASTSAANDMDQTGMESQSRKTKFDLSKVSDEELDGFIDRAKNFEQLAEDYSVDDKYTKLAQRMFRSMWQAKMDRRILEERLHTVMGYNGGRAVKLVQLDSREQDYVLTNYRSLVKRVVCFNYVREFMMRKQWQKMQSILQVVISFLGPVTDEIEQYIKLLGHGMKQLPASEWREALLQSVKLGYPSFSDSLCNPDEFIHLISNFAAFDLNAPSVDEAENIADTNESIGYTENATTSQDFSVKPTSGGQTSRSRPSSRSSLRDKDKVHSADLAKLQFREHGASQSADKIPASNSSSAGSLNENYHMLGDFIPFSKLDEVRSKVSKLIQESVNVDVRMDRINPLRDATTYAESVAERQYSMLYPLESISSSNQNENKRHLNQLRNPASPGTSPSSNVRQLPGQPKRDVSSTLTLRQDNQQRLNAVMNLMSCITTCAQSNVAGFVAMKQSREELLIENSGLRQQVCALQKELEQERANTAAMRSALMDLHPSRGSIPGNRADGGVTNRSYYRQRPMSAHPLSSSPGMTSRRAIHASPSTLKLVEKSFEFKQQQERSIGDDEISGSDSEASAPPCDGSRSAHHVTLLSLRAADEDSNNASTAEQVTFEHKRGISLTPNLQTHNEECEEEEKLKPTKETFLLQEENPVIKNVLMTERVIPLESHDDRENITLQEHMELREDRANTDEIQEQKKDESEKLTLQIDETIATDTQVVPTEQASKETFITQSKEYERLEPEVCVEEEENVDTLLGKHNGYEAERINQLEKIRRFRPQSAFPIRKSNVQKDFDSLEQFEIDKSSKRERPQTAGATSNIKAKPPTLPVKYTRSSNLRNTHRLMKIQLMQVLENLNSNTPRGQTDESNGLNMHMKDTNVFEAIPRRLDPIEPRPQSAAKPKVVRRAEHPGGRYGTNQGVIGGGVWGDGSGIPAGEGIPVSFGEGHSSVSLREMLENSFEQQSHVQNQTIVKKLQTKRRPKSALLGLGSNRVSGEQLTQSSDSGSVAASYTAYGLTTQQLRLALSASAKVALQEAENSARKRSPQLKRLQKEELADFEQEPKPTEYENDGFESSSVKLENVPERQPKSKLSARPQSAFVQSRETSLHHVFSGNPTSSVQPRLIASALRPSSARPNLTSQHPIPFTGPNSKKSQVGLGDIQHSAAVAKIQSIVAAYGTPPPVPILSARQP